MARGQATQVKMQRRLVILVVDDDDDFRNLVSSLLDEDFEVIAAPDGGTALGKFRQYQPDIVVTDLIMPHLDGFMLIQEIRRRSHVPIFAVSGGITPAAEQLLVRLSAAFIAKHEVCTKLCNQLQEVLAEGSDLSQPRAS